MANKRQRLMNEFILGASVPATEEKDTSETVSEPSECLEGSDTCSDVNRRHPQERWLSIWHWLYFDNEGMFCQICREMQKKNPFTSKTGCRNYKTSTLMRHTKNKEHQNAVKELQMKKSFQQASANAE
ncbi:uncharacterized protein LOC144362193, partial [Saccoglossus kowalevskii]